ncbi:hypothetical protein SUGI_0966850 [Cryptomeria japonica]|nr:hypothetical protein SUGI_0966850 [Cryptomeria japonica]
MCVVHDDNGLFSGRLQILERYYEDTLLPFFSSNLGVSLHPRIEDYCNLWLDWIRSNHVVTECECCSVWRNIVKHWTQSPSAIKGKLGKQGLKFPAHTSGGDIQLCSPNETFIPDDLLLKELFRKVSTEIKYAWHPNPSDPEIPLDFLFSIYESLGARKISQAVEKKEVSVSSGISLCKLQAGESLFGKGLYIIILGYLADPSFKLSADKRHQIVRALLESSAYEAAQSFGVMYTLTITTEDDKTEHIKVAAHSPVRWERDSKRILVQKSDPQSHDQKAKVSMATEFAEVVSKGLLSEHPELVAGLCEMVKFGCILGFDTDVVNYMLQYKNLQIFKEDESFLSKFFPIADYLGPYQGSGPAKSAWHFSPDFVQGWESRLQMFKQGIDNMEDCTVTSIPLKIKMVRMLFPSDKKQPESSSDLNLMKVTGDACLKMLTVSEVVGANANESCQMMPFKLENLLGDDVLELGKCFGPPSSSGDECDIEMVRAVAGAATLNFFAPKL